MILLFKINEIPLKSDVYPVCPRTLFLSFVFIIFNNFANEAQGKKKYPHFCNFVLNIDLLNYLSLKLESVPADTLWGNMHSAVVFWRLDFGKKFHVSDTAKVDTKVKY